MRNKINQIFPEILLNPTFRAYRHIFLQIIIFFISINLLWDTPDRLLLSNDRIIGWILYLGILELITYINLYILAPRFLFKQKIDAYVFRVLILIVIAILLIALLPELLIKDMEQNHEFISRSQIVLNIISSVTALGLYMAGISTFLIFKNWIINNQKLQELETQTLESELKFLKNQINPHFLFNMLNNATYLILENSKQATEVLLKLEDLLRYQINDTSREKVKLIEDIRFLQDYLNLEKIRRDDFVYEVTKEGELEEVYLSPFIFLPFVENAVKHGQDTVKTAYIKVNFKVYNNILEFTCENSLPESKNEEPQSVGGLGLNNIRRRLALIYPDRYTLEINQDKEKYTIKLKLNL